MGPEPILDNFRLILFITYSLNHLVLQRIYYVPDVILGNNAGDSFNGWDNK